MILSELRLVRNRLGMSIDEIASQLGVSEPTVSRWLRGKGLTLDALDDLCRCMGTDLRTLIDQASEPATERFSLRQERILAADRLLSLLFFLVLNGAQREWLERDFRLPPAQFDQLIDRLVRLGLVHKGSNGRLRPLVKRSIRWQANGPLALAFERTVLAMLLGPDFGRKGTRYVSQFALLDEAGRDFVHARFEALIEEILRGPGYVGSPSPDREWSVLFLMTRPVAISEMLGWTEGKEAAPSD
jgi:transcriptional regulator with XRE-family HTH domain